MPWLAIDVGGANLKFANGEGYAESRPFPMWKQPAKLAHELRRLIAEAPTCDRLVVTMTGELADCFESKSAGIEHILSHVVQAADGRHARIYLNDGKIVAPQIAERKPLLAAASNWHALARFCGRYAPDGSALLIDIGSTTCDIIPLFDGDPFGVSQFDTERLMARELIYTGVERSPICAIVEEVPYRDHTCPVAQELFATAYDAYVLLGHLKEDTTRTDTADGRPAIKSAARRRLGRMICADEIHFNHRDAVGIARHVMDTQARKLTDAARAVIETMASPPSAIIVAGQGEFLAKRVVDELEWDGNLVELSSKLSEKVSRCATAHGLAVIAREATT